MPGKRTVKSEIVLELLKKFPNTPSLTLAKKALEENKSVFSNVEDARATIRYHRGSIGKFNRESIASNEHFREFDKSLFNPFKLPTSDEAEFLPFYLSQDCRKILCLYDIHVPYHNIEALSAAIQKGIEEKVDTIFLGGDFLDFYQLSRFDKDPRKRGFANELETGRQIIAKLREIFPKARIYFKIGNHEERYEKYLLVKAPELLDCSEFKLDILLKFGEYRVDLITDKRITHAGKLRLLHGHEFSASVFSPVNPARGYYMRAKLSMMAGHNHQTSEHTEPNIDNEITTVWSVGCLSELHPAYMPINKWNHGFAVVTLDEYGNYSVNNYRILNGKIL